MSYKVKSLNLKVLKIMGFTVAVAEITVFVYSSKK
jgi:hypothetical protein